MTEQSSLVDILAIENNTYKTWMEYQFTPEVNWKNIDVDHLRPVSSFDISDDEV